MLDQGVEFYSKLECFDLGIDLCLCKDTSHCKDTLHSREEGRLDGGGADPARILVKRVMQTKTGSKESHVVNEEVVV